MSKILISILILLAAGLPAQMVPQMYSVHKEESDYYSQFTKEELARMFEPAKEAPPRVYPRGACKLDKIVFGFHPYWEEGAEVHYQWDLLSDFCYFGYKVDPATGAPSTVHEWLTAGSVNAAKAHGTRLHLAMTLFSGHDKFLNNKTAQRNFSNTIISLLKKRNAIGVNLDIEAVPKTLKRQLTAFVLFFGNELHKAIPGSILSIDIPAVDWSGTFEIKKMNKVVDIYFVMGYGYYYGGSSESGPTAPLYSFVDYYDYNLSRSVSYYQSVGMPLDKMVLGLPYYGKTWKVSKTGAPAKTLGKGTTVFYRDTRKNENGYFSRSNARWAGTCFANYFLYKKSNAWYHAFVLSANEQRSKMEIIRLRGLAGTGMWALGYDDGYNDLWDVLRETMTECYQQPCKGTLYDNGGPSGDYYNSESNSVMLHPAEKGRLKLKFSYFSTVKDEDYLSIYDGKDAKAKLIGKYTGTISVPEIMSTGPYLYLRFHSNGATRRKGYKAVWTCDTMDVGTVNPEVKPGVSYNVTPNPSQGKTVLHLNGLAPGRYELFVYNLHGKKMVQKTIHSSGQPVDETIDLKSSPKGFYKFYVKNKSHTIMVSGSVVIQ